MNNKKIVLVTGANRGLGLEAAKTFAEMGYYTILSGRNADSLDSVISKLKDQFQNIDSVILDMSDKQSIRHAADGVLSKYGKIDILVNNAGILIDDADSGADNSILTINSNIIHKTMMTNVYGPLLLSQLLIPKMKENDFGRIVNVSSAMGQLSDMNGLYPAYRISKVSLNALTMSRQNELKGTTILVNSVSPGWVRTDMGGKNAPRSLEEGVQGMIRLATLVDGGPSGLFFRDGDQLDW